jgi:hypothetical protein
MSASTRRKKATLGIPAKLADDVLAEVEKCKTDPARFNETILCRGPYWSKQREVCRSVIRHNVTSVPSGNAVGKSFLAAGLAAHFATCHVNCRVVVAAPTKTQLEKVFWAELRNCFTSAEENGRHVGGRFRGLTYELGDDWMIEGYGQGSVESASGRHAADLLAIVDEASGVKDGILEAINSLNPSRIVYFGNPLRADGRFYHLCERIGNASIDGTTYNVIRIPSLLSPDIHLPRSRRGMADQDLLNRSRSEYGEDSQWWASHILALFPGELQSLLIVPDWLQIAARTLHLRGGRIVIGVDVGEGNGGDPSCIAERDSGGVTFGEEGQWSFEETARRVAARQAINGGPDRVTVVFDKNGPGADFGNRLQAAGVPNPIPFVGSVPVPGDEGLTFLNLRAFVAWRLRQRLDPQRMIAPEEAKPARGGPTTLFDHYRRKQEPVAIWTPQKPFAIPEAYVARWGDELGGIRYHTTATTGSIALEPKEDFIARRKKSPNFLDALSMTFLYE